MQRKPIGYILLSFLSFAVFTTVFHTVANAQESELIPAPTRTPTIAVLPPTPTIANKQNEPVQLAVNTNVPEPEVTSMDIPQPTPTIYIAPTKAPDPTPTPTAVPTIAPTTAPTLAPTATPIPQPTVATSTDLESLFTKYASEYGIDKEDLKRIAKCESGFNPNADTGLYAGMYQFNAQTWASTRSAMGLDTNPDLRKNAEESIRTAAFKIKNGGRSAWPNC